MNGKMIIFTAPSGSGKTTLVRYLLKEIDVLSFSVSATTRKKRKKETDGKDYYFLSDEKFERIREEKGFLEWEEVYPGAFYGTLQSEVERLWEEEKVVIFDIDVHGAKRLKKKFPNNSLAVFVKAPSLAHLEKRLIFRNTEDIAVQKKRLEKAKSEMAFENHFDITVINDDLDKAKAEVREIVISFLKK